ncbi:MAG TPA: hypothetical protein VME46_02925, partial [Acidimicrobiales bacterium]|nr:hypothetical protein [Acidimicrobiales bacterium]
MSGQRLAGRYGNAWGWARRRLFGRAPRAALVAAIVTAGLSSASPPAGASSEEPGQAASQGAGPLWV